MLDINPRPRGRPRRATIPSAPTTGSGERWANSLLSQSEQFELKRRSVILEAGREIGKRGFAGTSLDDVARTLNVTKPALYYYIKNKHEILFECHKLAFEYGERSRAHALSLGGSRLDVLGNFFQHYITSLIDELGGGAVMTEHHHLRPEDDRALQPMRDEFDHFLRQAISDGIKEGSIRDCDPKMAIFFIFGAIRGIHRWYKPGGQLSAAEIAGSFVDLIRHSLANGGGQ